MHAVETLPQAIARLMDDLGLISVREVARLATTYPGPERVTMSTIARWASNPMQRPEPAKLRPLAWALTPEPRTDAAYQATLGRLQTAARRAPEEFGEWRFDPAIASRLSIVEREFLEQLARMLVNTKDTYYEMGLRHREPADNDADNEADNEADADQPG